MATETDLRDLLDELEQGAPTVRDVLDRLTLDRPCPAIATARPRRRPAWAVTGAIAACAAVIVGVGALSQTIGHHSSTGTSATSAALRTELLPTWHFTVAAVPGYTIKRISITRLDPVTSVAQRATVASKTSRVTGDLDVFVPAPGQSLRRTGNFGAVADGGLGPRQALTINGHRAYYVRPSALTPHELRTTHGDRWAAAAENLDNQPQLYWQLPDRATVELAGTFGFKPASATWNDQAAFAALTKFAAATSYSLGQSVNMPFRLATDPHGFIPVGVEIGVHSRCIGYGTGMQERPTDPNWDWYYLCLYTGTRPSDQTVTSRTVATRRLPDGATLALAAGGWPKQAAPITMAEGRQILRDADVTPVPADPTTWLPIR